MQAKNHDMVPNSQIDNDSRVWEEMISGREYDATHPYLLEKLNATKDRIWAVSYTHLTLPTILLV